MQVDHSRYFITTLHMSKQNVDEKKREKEQEENKKKKKKEK